MTKKQQLFKLTLASSFAALSIVLDIVFKSVVTIPNFGFPYYAIPLVVGSIMLGPIYGGMMGFVSDAVGFFLGGGSPQGFNILFSFAAIAWGILPSLLTFKKKHILFLLISVVVTHLVATSFSTLADYIAIGPKYAWTKLSLRVVWLPLNVAIITGVSYVLLKTLRQLSLHSLSHKKHQHIESKNSDTL